MTAITVIVPRKELRTNTTWPAARDSVLSQLAPYDELIDVLDVPARGSYGAFARNDAMKTAKGDLLVFLDDDDVLAPNALNKIRETAALDKLNVYANQYGMHTLSGDPGPPGSGALATSCMVPPRCGAVEWKPWPCAKGGNELQYYWDCMEAGLGPAVFHQWRIVWIRPHQYHYPEISL